MKLEPAVPRKMDSGERQGGAHLWKNDAEPVVSVQTGNSPQLELHKGQPDTPMQRIAGLLNEGLQINPTQTPAMGPRWVTDALHRVSEHMR